MCIATRRIFSACFLTTAYLAALEQTIDESHPIKTSFSLNAHNRIAVAGGTVEKIFGDESFFSITLDPLTGQAFINVLEEIDDPGALLTVVSGSGHVQDIEVSSHEGSSTFLLLKEPDEDLCVKSHGLSHAPTIDLLNQILEQKIPFGYGERPMEIEEALQLPAPLTVHSCKAFVGPFETVFVYEIENEGDVPIVLSPDALNQKYTWSFFNLHELNGKQKALCITGRCNG